MFTRYEEKAGYRITTPCDSYTVSGGSMHTALAHIIEQDCEILSIEKFCDDYYAYTLALAKGELHK